MAGTGRNGRKQFMASFVGDVAVKSEQRNNIKAPAGAFMFMTRCACPKAQGKVIVIGTLWAPAVAASEPV